MRAACRLLIRVCLVGFGLTARKVAPVQAFAPPTETVYRIQPGDLLQPGCRIVDDTFPQFAAVGENGKVALPLIEDIQAAGKTLEQFNADVMQEMRKYLTLPDGTIPFLTLRVMDRSYVIKPGDLMDFDPNAGDTFGPWAIRQDGTIPMPIYGDVLAAGKTIAQLNTELVQLMISRSAHIRGDTLIFRAVLKQAEGYDVEQTRVPTARGSKWIPLHRWRR